MPRLSAADNAKHRSKAELEAYRATLQPVKNSGCGHTAISADEYYARINEGGQVLPGRRQHLCVDCYREQERIRQRARQGKLTIEDIRNPDRKSGFDYVNKRTDSRPGRSGESYRAQRGPRIPGNPELDWNGAVWPTAEEAAQEYCDHINKQRRGESASLNYAGHGGQREQIERDEEVEAALGILRDKRAQRKGRKGFVYVIGVEGDSLAVKIGYSVNPEARIGELQSGNPRKLKLLKKIKGTPADERKYHAKFRADNLIGEWFTPSPILFSTFGLPTNTLASVQTPDESNA